MKVANFLHYSHQMAGTSALKKKDTGWFIGLYQRPLKSLWIEAAVSMKKRSRRVVTENSGLVHQVGIAARSRSSAESSGTDCQRSGGSGPGTGEIISDEGKRWCRVGWPGASHRLFLSPGTTAVQLSV